MLSYIMVEVVFTFVSYTLTWSNYQGVRFKLQIFLWYCIQFSILSYLYFTSSLICIGWKSDEKQCLRRLEIEISLLIQKHLAIINLASGCCLIILSATTFLRIEKSCFSLWLLFEPSMHVAFKRLLFLMNIGRV